MTILYVILGIVAVLLIIAALMPKTFTLKAETTINAPKDHVRDYVRLLGNQKFYSVRVMKDPAVKLTYSGTDGEIGAGQTWTSEMKDVGAGAQEITAMDPGNSYEVEIRFEQPMKATNYAKTTVEWVLPETAGNPLEGKGGAEGGGFTRVSNVFWGVNPWPGNLISLFFLPKVEKDMQQNMDNLKKNLETK
jgi:hypothetical protein